MNQASYYQSHLDQVSRSFAFCIAQLKSPLREWVGLSYLLFRNLDTIEDAKWQNSQDQNRAYELFHSLFDNPENLLKWNLHLPSGLPDAEVKLIKETPKLVQDYYSLPISVQLPLKKSLITMSLGMQHFSQKKELKLQSLQEVNQYCFFVAGLVGELLTDLVLQLLPPSEQKQELYFSSVQFGIFLQKINVLKDQMTDEKEKRFLVPDRNQLLNSLISDAEGALQYLISLPTAQKEYRLFCAWSLFLGLKSLSFIQNSWLSRVLDKIPRSMTTQLLAQVESLIDDNQALANYFYELTTTLKKPKATFPQEDGLKNSDQWLLKIYQGQLSTHDLGKLGLISSYEA